MPCTCEDVILTAPAGALNRGPTGSRKHPPTGALKAGAQRFSLGGSDPFGLLFDIAVFERHDGRSLV